MSSFTHPENKNRYIRCCLLSSAQHSITYHPLSGFENDTLSDIFDLYIFFIFVWIFIIHASAWKQNFCLLVYSAAPLEATTISKLIVTDQPTSVLSPWKPERGLLTLFFFFFLPQMEKSVARVLYGQGTSLNLTSRKIKAVPECVFRIKKLSVLQLNNNSISALPAELRSLRRVSLPSFFRSFCSRAHLSAGTLPRQLFKCVTRRADL